MRLISVEVFHLHHHPLLVQPNSTRTTLSLENIKLSYTCTASIDHSAISTSLVPLIDIAHHKQPNPTGRSPHSTAIKNQTASSQRDHSLMSNKMINEAQFEHPLIYTTQGRNQESGYSTYTTSKACKSSPTTPTSASSARHPFTSWRQSRI